MDNNSSISEDLDQNFNINDDESDLPKLEESIKISYEAFEAALESNSIESAIQMVEPFADKSLYHSSLKSLFIILNAALTLKADDLERASKSASETAELSNKLRKTGFFDSVTKMIITPNYDKYTDIELHAELTYAKFLALSAGLSIMETTNIVSLIKVAYRLRVCMNSYKECRDIFKKRTKWESETSKLHFEAGVRLAHGITNLLISHIPPRLLKIVNFLGYKGVRSVGFDEINKAAFELPGVSSKLAQLVLLGYWLYAEPHGCLGPKDLTVCRQLVDKELKRYPNSLLYRGAKAKLQQIDGNIDSAIKMYNELLKMGLEESHKVFHFELLWCHALKCQWDQCIKYAECLRKETLHSPACTTYLEAVFRYIKSVEDLDDNIKEEATKLFQIVPTLRIRYLGKTVTPEKMAVEFSNKYFKNNKFLLLPEIELLYYGNFLYFINDNKTLLNKLMERVEKQVQYYERDLLNNEFLDNYLTAMFYKGVLYKHLGKLNSAFDCFNIVLNEEARIEKQFSIPPQAVLELGLTHLAAQRHEEAHTWLDKAITDYSGYLTENLVHVRVYAALRELGISTDKEKEDISKREEYAKQWFKENELEENAIQNLLKSENIPVISS